MDDTKTTGVYAHLGVRRVRDDAIGLTVSGTEYVLGLKDAKAIASALQSEAFAMSETMALRGVIMNLRGWLLNIGDAETATADKLRMMATKALAGVECDR
jgi:hypothetical protein